MGECSLPSLYATRPDLYDLMHADHSDDMRFLYEFVQSLGEAPQVLELGCGSGRLLLPMLDAGASVTGVDNEPLMLETARQRLAPYTERARLVAGDMQTFSVSQRFDLAVVGLNTFMHLLDTEAQLRTLERLHLHLRPGGMLLLDLANPHTVLRDVPLSVLQHRFTKHSAEGEALITLWSCTTVAPAEQLVQTLLFFDEVGPERQEVRRTATEVLLRLTYRFELELLLARTGFALRYLYGDYESGPYEDDSERLIAVAAALA